MNCSDLQASRVSGIQPSLPRSDMSQGTSLSSIACAVQLSEECTNLNDDSQEAKFHIIFNSGRLSESCRSQVLSFSALKSLVLLLREHGRSFYRASMSALKNCVVFLCQDLGFVAALQAAFFVPTAPFRRQKTTHVARCASV